MSNTPRSSATSELETSSNSRPPTPTSAPAAAAGPAEQPAIRSQESVEAMEEFLARAYNGNGYSSKKLAEIQSRVAEKQGGPSIIGQITPSTFSKPSPKKFTFSIWKTPLEATDAVLKAAAEKAISPEQSPRRS